MQVNGTRMYKVSAVAELLDVSRSTVYRAIESGELDALRIGNALRVPGEALAGWLDRCGQEAYERHVGKVYGWRPAPLVLAGGAR